MLPAPRRPIRSKTRRFAHRGHEQGIPRDVLVNRRRTIQHRGISALKLASVVLSREIAGVRRITANRLLCEFLSKLQRIPQNNCWIAVIEVRQRLAPLSGARRSQTSLKDKNMKFTTEATVYALATVEVEADSLEEAQENLRSGNFELTEPICDLELVRDESDDLNELAEELA
jgi:hypothetical protein